MPDYDTKQSHGEASLILKLWPRAVASDRVLSIGHIELDWIACLAPDKVLSMGQIELNCVFMLNWIAWNKTVFIFKLRTNAKQNCFK